MNVVKRFVLSQPSSAGHAPIWRPFSTCHMCRQASSSSSAGSPPPPPKSAKPQDEEDDEYTTSWDLTSPTSVSHDSSAVDEAKVSPALLNLTPRERRLKQLSEVKSTKQLNRMLGSIQPASWTLKDSELKETFVRGSGNGGQAINKLSTSVSLIHLPTGIRVQAQPTRSLQDNRIAARKILAEKLANLDPSSSKASRSDVLAAKARLKKQRSAKKSSRKYNAKEDTVEAIAAPAPPLEGTKEVGEDSTEEEWAEEDAERENVAEGMTSRQWVEHLKKGDEEVKAKLKRLAKEEKRDKRGKGR